MFTNILPLTTCNLLSFIYCNECNHQIMIVNICLATYLWKKYQSMKKAKVMKNGMYKISLQKSIKFEWEIALLENLKPIHLTTNYGNFDCILFCTTTGYFLPFFSSLLKKRKEEKENEVAKPFFFSRCIWNSPKLHDFF